MNTLRILKELWEFLCVLLLGVPMMIVGYFGTFLVRGVVVGHMLHTRWHQGVDTNPDSGKTSP